MPLEISPKRVICCGCRQSQTEEIPMRKHLAAMVVSATVVGNIKGW